ncbi:hypothetical protein C0J52_10392 [Blattella germanica]|nr:hypothetical protein C0J52_10392 [Blattella germanica]
MPKRMCPFDYDLLPQQKIHIGEKEMQNEFWKTSVYEKTLNMLFMGARKPPRTETNEMKGKNCTSEQKPSYKQMLFSQKCSVASVVDLKQKIKPNAHFVRSHCVDILKRNVCV